MENRLIQMPCFNELTRASFSYPESRSNEFSHSGCHTHTHIRTHMHTKQVSQSFSYFEQHKLCSVFLASSLPCHQQNDLSSAESMNTVFLFKALCSISTFSASTDHSCTHIWSGVKEVYKQGACIMIALSVTEQEHTSFGVNPKLHNTAARKASKHT